MQLSYPDSYTEITLTCGGEKLILEGEKSHEI